jgi:regulator of protease activity HflC (stomatin/prohibitin superfamily)
VAGIAARRLEAGPAIAAPAARLTASLWSQSVDTRASPRQNDQTGTRSDGGEDIMNRRILLIAVATLFVATGCYRIDSGHSGVKWKFFGGTVMDQTYGEGVHIVPPWDRMYVYDVRTQDRKEDLQILTNNGLSVSLETSIRYRAIAAQLAMLHQEIGPRYFDVIIAPVVRSEARKVGGRYTPEEIYSTKREAVGIEIYDEVTKALEGKHVELQAILLRNVDLPKLISQAITEKLEEEQNALKMEFTLNRERQEAERKRIEAKGISDFQKIVSQGISEALLRWKGIEATEKLALSQNSKVVVIGSGKDGLPIILGGAN